MRVVRMVRRSVTLIHRFSLVAMVVAFFSLTHFPAHWGSKIQLHHQIKTKRGEGGCCNNMSVVVVIHIVHQQLMVLDDGMLAFHSFHKISVTAYEQRERGEVGGKDLYAAATKGDVTRFQELLKEDPHLLDVVSFACSRNLLHIAAMYGQAGIVEEVLRRNPQLARDLDSQNRSPLHIAAAQGNLEIVSIFLSIAPDMCWSRDCQGMNPIHIAAMNGHVEVLEELVRVDPFPATEKLDRGHTMLHLCVKHRQLKTLEVLVENLGELVYEEDDDGETVLHSAVRFNQVEVVRYLVENNKIKQLSTNSKAKTLQRILRERSPNPTSTEIKEIFISKRPDLLQSVKVLSKMSDITMVVVVLIATMAFQAAANPPGGVWQDDESSPPRKAGEAVMASNRPKIFKSFTQANTAAFASSLVAIFLLTTGLPSKDGAFTAAVMISMWVSLTSIAVSYGASILVITPNMETHSLAHVITIVVIVSLTIYLIYGYVTIFVKLRSWAKTPEASRPRPSLWRPDSFMIHHIGRRLEL